MYYLIKGPDGYFNYDDIGIIWNTRFFGTPWIYLVYLLTINLVMIWIKRISSNALISGLLISFMMSLTIMSYLDRPQIIALVLTLVIVNKESLKVK